MSNGTNQQPGTLPRAELIWAFSPHSKTRRSLSYNPYLFSQSLHTSIAPSFNRSINTPVDTRNLEIFLHPAYAALFEHPGVEAAAFRFEGSEGTVIYPFLLHDLSLLPFFPQGSAPAFHIETPYGYGGPAVIEGTPTKQLYLQFYEAFARRAKENNIVSEFVRFDLFSEARQYFTGKVEQHNHNIVLDLTPSIEDIWTGFDHKVRKNVHKAISKGVEVFVDPSGNQLDQFLENYHHTLQRRNAAKRYYFGKEFFQQINKTLSGKYCYFHCVHQGQVISSELVLLSGSTIYSFLGGTLADYFHLRPSDLLKYRIIEWAKENGCHKFVIGGGHQPHDGIFAFKKAFAPQGLVPFYIGKVIHNQEAYNHLVEASGKEEGGFFPAFLSE
jgi:hypothetical protein